MFAVIDACLRSSTRLAKVIDAAIGLQPGDPLVVYAQLPKNVSVFEVIDALGEVLDGRRSPLVGRRRSDRPRRKVQVVGVTSTTSGMAPRPWTAPRPKGSRSFFWSAARSGTHFACASFGSRRPTKTSAASTSA